MRMYEFGVLEGHGDVVHDKGLVTILGTLGLDDDFFWIDGNKAGSDLLPANIEEQSLRRGAEAGRWA